MSKQLKSFIAWFLLFMVCVGGIYFIPQEYPSPDDAPVFVIAAFFSSMVGFIVSIFGMLDVF